ncbi:MAG TPA: hypothetical protein VFV05_22885 [Methylomirabilota bacterium]|nr:hypothetical protein [Methylomirabilota bacterium]
MIRWAIVALVVLAVLWAWLRAFAWFDPLALCRIHIDVELLEGDRGPIRAAIATVRREDPPAYRALCHWVDRIQEERQCDAGDPQADARVRRGAGAPLDPALVRARAAPGCYVRGSRVIVLRRPPEGGGDPALARERAEALKRLARYSQAFWIDRLR